MIDTALLSLLHLLVFVYWLGGDVGAFYASSFMTRADVPADRKLFAARLLNDIDMCPRTAIVLAFPTGFALALNKGWIEAPAWTAAMATAAAAAWLAIVWGIHLSHGAAGALKVADAAIRWSAFGLVALYGALGLAGVVDLPLFIALKCLALAAAIACGLAIRHVARPLAGAFAQLAAGEEAIAHPVIRSVMARARPIVLAIWTILAGAAFLGLWAPA